MKQSRKFLFGSLLSALILFLVPTLKAQSCDGLVVDDASVFGSGLGKVQSAAEKLLANGADVRVLTVQSIGSAATLDQFEKSVESSCRSWQSPDGGRKNNLIVLLFTPEPSASAKRDGRKTNGQSGIYFGSLWRPALGGNQWARVRVEVMGPRIKDHDYAGAFAAGLEDVNRLVDLQLHPPTPGTKVVVETPTDYSPLASAFKWLVIILFVALLAVGAFVFFFRRKSEEEDRGGGQQKALLAQQKFTRLSGQLNDRFAEFDALTSDKDLVQRVRSIIDTAVEMYSNVKTGPKGDPNVPNLTRSQYLEIASEYDRLTADLQRAERLMQGRKAEEEIPPPVPRSQSGASAPQAQPVREEPRHHRHRHHEEVEPREREVVVEHETTVIPVIIPEEREVEYERPEPRHHREPDPEPEPDREEESGGGSGEVESSSSNDSSGGGSDDSSGGSDDGGGGGGDA